MTTRKQFKLIRMGPLDDEGECVETFYENELYLVDQRMKRWGMTKQSNRNYWYNNDTGFAYWLDKTSLNEGVRTNAES